MYKIIVDGEVVEIVTTKDEEYTIDKYVKDKYIDCSVKIERLL